MDSFGTDEYINYIVSNYSQTLFRAAYSLLGNTADAQDAVQDAFVKLIEKRPVFRDGEHEKAWLIRVTLNISKNMLKAKSYGSAYTEGIVSHAPGNPNTDVLDAVRSLDKKYSVILHLYYYEDMSIAEIARLLRLPSATVGTRLSRGRAALKEKLRRDVE